MGTLTKYLLYVLTIKKKRRAGEMAQWLGVLGCSCRVLGI